MTLVRYWFEFELSLSDPHPLGTLSGCGVTAYDRGDALRLIQERIFAGGPLPALKKTIENVDISQLDQAHIRPNMGVPIVRGIWYPLGYGE